MNNILSKKILFISIFSLTATCLALPSYAFDNEDKPNFKAAFAAEMGTDMYEVKLGMGYWQNSNEHGQFYISRLQAEDTLKVDKISTDKQKYYSNRIGIEASSFNESRTYQGGLFLYNNKSRANIDRVGFGVSVALGTMLTSKTRFLIGADVMPEYFSSDWDAKAFLEYEAKAMLTQRLTNSIDIGINYRHGGVLDSKSVIHYSQATLGFSLKL